MDGKQFKEFASAAADFLVDYTANLEKKPVMPSIKPGYLNELIPNEPPLEGESWKNILQDVERVVVPGLTHWQSPHFHGYFPSGTSYPAIVAEMISAGFGCAGLNWMASPVYTELEASMMDWLAKLLGLPECFLNCSESRGGGVIQSSASETTLVALLASKERKCRELRSIHQLDADTDTHDFDSKIKARLVAYSSDQSNSSVEKAGILGSVRMRLLKTDVHGKLRGQTLRTAIEEDRAKGLIPFYVVAALGTTPTCAFDPLDELGEVCRAENVWLHVDAAYAGTAFACPEFRYLMKGVDLVDSFNFNPHKWMLTTLDCSAMWVKDVRYLVEAFSVERIYLEDTHRGSTPEYRHWQISLGRRLRALKLWFVMRIYGVEGIRAHVRKHVGLAEYFARLMAKDARFEVCSLSLGLVCFKLIGNGDVNGEENAEGLTKALLTKVMERKRIFVIAGHFNEEFCIRFAVCGHLTEREHIEFAWDEFQSQAYEVCASKRIIYSDFKSVLEKKNSRA